MVVAGLGVVTIAIPVGAAAVKLPQAGVICDTSTRICYTGDGPSLNQTRREFGSRAEQDLLRRLSGRPRAGEFTLSSGELCDLAQRTCWGNRVQVRWADLQLETVRRGGDGGYGSGNGSGGFGGGYGQGYGPGDRGAPDPDPNPVSPGQALETILNGLFK